MLIALRLILNLLLALLVSLFGAVIVLSSHRRPNTWLWGAVFGMAISLTMAKPVAIEPGWLFDFRVVVVALSGFAGGLPTYLTAAVIASVYRIYLGGAGTVPGVLSVLIAGLVGVYFGRQNSNKTAPSVSGLLALGLLLATIKIFLVWVWPLVSGRGAVITLQLVLLFLSLTPPGTAIAFRLFAVVYRRLTEQATLEAAAASLPTAISVLDAKGRVLSRNKAAERAALSHLPRVAGVDPVQIEGRKYMVGRQPWRLRSKELGELVTLDDVTDWHDAIDQLHSFFQLALDFMVILGPSDEIVQVNKAAGQFGLQPPLGFLDLVHSDERPVVVAALKAVRGDMSEGGSFQCRFAHADGSLRWLEWSCVADLPGGNIYAVGRDVSQDRKYIDALLTTTALLKEQSIFLELAYDAVIVRELGGKITFWNSGASSTYGYSRAEAVGVQYDELLGGTYPVPLAHIEAELERNEEWYGEVERFHRDGRKMLVSCRWVLKRNEHLLPVAVLEVSRDITEQARTRQATAHLAALVEQSKDAILSADISGRILTANGAAGTLLNRTAASLVGESVLTLVQPEQRGNLKQELDSVCRERAARRATLHMRTSTGALVPVAITFSLMPDQHGRDHGISLILSDLTAKQARDKEITRLDRLSLASQLARGIGHEVRNPLTTIRGFLQLFCLRSDLSTYAEQFKLLIGAIDRMNETLTEFLALARNHPVDLVLTDINAVVRAAFGLLEADASQAGCVVKCELAAVPPIAASERAIRQVLVNLVRNGLEASAAGDVVVIGTQLIDNNVVLSVRDAGSGIPVDIRPQIGTPFFTTKPEGTGLGLTVCQAIALQHGATLTFDTGEEGTVFYMSFPVASPVEPNPPCLSAGT